MIIAGSFKGTGIVTVLVPLLRHLLPVVLVP